MANTFRPLLDASSTTPVGVVLPYGGSSSPTGWLLCDGSAVSRSTYSDLFNIIGETFGAGNGTTTFNIPDMRGRIPAGRDDMGGAAANRLTSTVMSPNGNTVGATGGAQTVTLDTTMIPSHGHTQNSHTHSITSRDGDGNSPWTRSGNAASADVSTPDGFAAATATNQNTGGGSAHSNTQPSIIFNYIIKT